MPKNFWQYLCCLALALSLMLGTLHLFRSDIFYETDISRDMLLLEDMVREQKISLIGGRSSMPGVFHGPLYYWLALPFFALSGGNPLAISFMWLGLYWLFLAGFYCVGKQTFDHKFALISTTLLASLTTFTPFGFTHTVLANFLITPFIFLLVRYFKSNKISWLIGAILTVGLLIQFQMAFGVPVLIMAGTWTIIHIIKKRQWSHLLAGFVIALPISTFIVFDLRHDFIQFRSALNYLTNDNSGSENINYWTDRLHSITDSFSVWAFPLFQARQLVSYLVIAALTYLAWHNWNSTSKNKTTISLTLLIIFGFWVVTLPFKGTVWPQYYRTLMPLIVFSLTYFLLTFMPKKLATTILFLLIGSNLFFALRSGAEYWQKATLADEVHWKFYRQMTSDIFADSEGKPFAYYVFSPDQYAYQGKYAMTYFSKAKQINTFPYSKKALTYLIIAPNDKQNPWANEEYWQAEQVKIKRPADKIWRYEAGYEIRRFDLSEEEIMVTADPNLLDGIHFR
jgi:4-amino-4-deoxy-L-arabinose transferase-like glycosyltransferase